MALGKVIRYFEKISVAVIHLDDTLTLGDKIKIGDVEMTVDSMQINRKPIEHAKKGESIGLKTPKRVEEGNLVEKI